MNVTALRQLASHIASVPEDRFIWMHGLSGGAMNAFVSHVPYPANTGGCIAGHACWIFDLRMWSMRAGCVMKAAAKFLGLSDAERDFLFVERCHFANRAAAIRRLVWLADHESMDGYPMRTEARSCGYVTDNPAEMPTPRRAVHERRVPHSGKLQAAPCRADRT